MLVTTHLFIPGPTNIPEAVRSAMDIRMEDMRSPNSPSSPCRCFEDVKKVFKIDERPRLHLPVVGHRRLGIGDLQHAEPRRQGSDEPLRPVLAAVGRHGRAPRPQRRGARRGVGHGRSGREVCRDPRRRQEPRDQGGLRHAQRDGHRRHLRHRRRAQGARRRQASCAAVRRRRLLGRLHRLPHGRVGRRLLRVGLAEGLHAADRPRHPRRQQQGARRQQDLEAWSAATSPSRT